MVNIGHIKCVVPCGFSLAGCVSLLKYIKECKETNSQFIFQELLLFIQISHVFIIFQGI